jgi:hypothetical protein
MLDEQDVQKLKEVFATREEILTRKSFRDFIGVTKEDIYNLKIKIDNYSANADKYFQELKSTS